MTDDLISRQAAIDALARVAREKFNLSDEFNHYLAGLMDGENAIRQLPPVQPETTRVLAEALNGSPLLYPCDELWSCEGWCKDHCKKGQTEPDTECWLKYAETIAAERREDERPES